MAGGGSSKSNPPKARKRVEVEAAAAAAAASSLVRAKDGSAFARCEECSKDVPVALISMHSCGLDAKIKMNLEAQVVEKPAEVKKKPADRKRSSEPKSKKAKTEKKSKKGKDANMPKRPATAFFLFMDDFRKTYKEANPDSKGVKEVAKQGGEKWKSMPDEEKKPYLDKASELKAEFNKAMEAHNADDGENEEGSDKEEAADKEESADEEEAANEETAGEKAEEVLEDE
ncbi:high mobility group B protein 7-like [Syzygium oleosum]|uniref:high mobility group B protein 7-like n=1 Tax=Syzygium oleosum TaxID=219896 RepID=UPI0011D283CF|nr:high mobility group B protein 7-like [Syzygium oleosum]